MGYATFNAASYVARSTEYKTKSRDELFQSQTVNKLYNPIDISVRESCDSEFNPESNAIIIGLDVTGSMGFIAEDMAKRTLGTLISGIIEKKPVSDPHIMMMAIGDINYDDAPLQATQFEADAVDEQLTDLYLEGGGGGNHYESYDLPWIFAARKTKIDCFDKRGKKGYLITIGDESPPRSADKNVIEKAIGVKEQSNKTAEQWLKEAQEKYEVFHFTIEEGWYASGHLNQLKKDWPNLLGKKAIFVNNYKYISEIIQSVIQVNEGEDPNTVINQWQDQDAKKAVEYSLFGSGQ